MTSAGSAKPLVRWTGTALSALTSLVLAWPSAVRAQAPAKEAPAAAQTPAEPEVTVPPLFEHWKTQFEIGGRNFDLYGDRPGRFFETRDVIRGVYVPRLNLRFDSAESPFMFSFTGNEIRELDETIKADLWRVGKWRTTFVWDRLPFFFGEGTSLWATAAPGSLVVSPAIRAGFQGVVNGQPPQNIPPALAPFARSELAAAPVSDMRIKRDQASLHQSVRFGRLELHGQWRSRFQRGARPKGIGTFARQNIGGTAVVNGAPVAVNDAVWESLGVELPEPVNYRTNELSVGARASGAKWRIGVDYGFTFFRNRITTLTYENPFRITNDVGTDNAGVREPGRASGRNRFVRQQLSLPPNTDFHNVTVRGGFDMPRDTQFRGLFSWGRSTQNDPFLPYTMNAALEATPANRALVLDGLGLADNLPPGTSVLTLSSLPQLSANGEVRSLNYDGTLVSKPWNNMRFRLQYRGDDMKNKSPRIEFPGQSRFGDSHWVTKSDYYGLPIENFPTSYFKQDAIFAWRWDVASRVTWNAEYQYESWKRTFRDAPRTGENKFRGQLDFQLARHSTLKFDYTYADRIPNRYITTPLVFNPAATSPASVPGLVQTYPAWEVVRDESTLSGNYPQFQKGVPLEFNMLRRFDVTNRRHHDARAMLDVGLGDKVTFSASGRFLRNNYSRDFYGLQFDEMAALDGEFTFSAGERTFLYVDYSHQLDRYEAKAIAGLINNAAVNGNPCCAQYPVANTWTRTSRSNLNFVQTGVNWASNGEKTAIDLSYGFSFAKDRIHAFNPFPILLNSPLSAGTYNYPDTKNGYQEVFFSITRRLRPGLDLGVEYRFDAYRLDDFYLNALQPYSQGLVTAGGISTNLPRQLLLNARFTTYHAHQEAFFLKYTF